MTGKFTFPMPELQLGFAFALKRFRAVYLQSALLETVRDMDITELDQQLAQFVKPADLAAMAQYGLRGELLFAVPAVLQKNPYLLGYYRLLMGYSQKEFYGSDKGFGVGYFKGMEVKGTISKKAADDLADLCAAFCETASFLLAGVGPLRLSRELLDDLTLLTVGPQLRGGANNERGTAGIVLVFEIIREIVAHAVAEVRESAMEVNSATGRPLRMRTRISKRPDCRAIPGWWACCAWRRATFRPVPWSIPRGTMASACIRAIRSVPRCKIFPSRKRRGRGRIASTTGSIHAISATARPASRRCSGTGWGVPWIAAQ